MKQIERELRQGAAGLPADAPPELGRLVAERAAREGLLDVVYALVDTPLGPLTVAATPRGLVRLAYPAVPTEVVLRELAVRVSPRILESPVRLDEVRRELDEYFAGRRRRFELPLDWSLTDGFTRRVLQVTSRIDYGEVRSYTEVARDAGSPRAVRAAGNALGANPIPLVVPCHRVVRTGGGLGGYGGGIERKEYLLQLEGALPGDS